MLHIVFDYFQASIWHFLMYLFIYIIFTFYSFFILSCMIYKINPFIIHYLVKNIFFLFFVDK